MKKSNPTYLDCRKILKSFYKKGYWNEFSSADIFFFLDETKRYLITFVEQFFGDSFGCQLFFNKTGMNYVHDILTTASENTVTICDCDSLCAVFVSKADLKPEEADWLKNMNVRIQEENNIVFYRFEPGYAQRLANNKELKMYLMVLEYLSSIIDNEYDDVVEAFRNTQSVVAVMDKENLQYSVLYRTLPFLLEEYTKQKPNLDFINEFKDSAYVNDECYCFASYLPVVVKETRIRPIVIYFFYPNLNKHYFKYIIDSPKNYKDTIFGILYGVFTEIGIPYKMTFNNRYIDSLLNKTIKAMKIEYSFLREDEVVDSNINDLLARVYQDSDDDFVEEEDCVKMLLDTIENTLNELSDLTADSFDEDENDNYVS